MLGDGIGYNAHWDGLTCDQLHHSDLFWACRGGAGGSFGIQHLVHVPAGELVRHDVSFYRFD